MDAIEILGFTPGEKALVFSVNTRWLADCHNLEQRLGMQPVHYLFSPTQHDPLAQAPGHYQVDLLLHEGRGPAELDIYQASSSDIREIQAENSDHGFSISMDTKAGSTLKISVRGSMVLRGIKITKRLGILWD